MLRSMVDYLVVIYFPHSADAIVLSLSRPSVGMHEEEAT